MMTTAIIISELLPLHDDELIADIDRIFDEIDASVEPTPPGEAVELLLIVDELVDEMLADDGDNQLSISLEIGETETKTKTEIGRESDEVAEVA